ncbi:hypothetical protein [Novosphingobium sp.]|uniref:hypothetical protein n=1 Tax=Novosphingobium sp. TaxID=1874826 RepID=UPI0025DB0A85|nr:hypothetical protein [Novosphingobium sp.]
MSDGLKVRFPPMAVILDRSHLDTKRRISQLESGHFVRIGLISHRHAVDLQAGLIRVCVGIVERDQPRYNPTFAALLQRYAQPQ